MIKYHTDTNGKPVAEILPGSDIIASPDDILDIMVSAGYQDCNKLVIHDKSLHQNFFDLKTGLAGEILQKFSNYRMKLAIVGDFSGTKSRSFHDFVTESNKWGIISFVDSLEKALT